mmetsp:Transcript_182469/g.578247  ORF Transcript_182469/g.578247 Transcript_182469/m.578247 type:complete len:247 (+) Transcript_182469:75-815(+)
MVSKDVFGLPLPPSAAGLRLPPKVAERGCAGAGHAAGEEGLRRFGGGGAASNASSSSPPTCHGSSNSLGSCQSSPSSPSTPPRGGDGVVDTLPGRLALPAMNDRGVDILNTFIATTYTGFMSTVMRQFRARFADPSAPVRRPATATPADDRQLVGPTVSRAAALAAPAPLQVPASEQEKVVSNVGSSLHELGNCKPCLFVFSPDGCSIGALCTFCHIWHGRTSRPSKAKRYRLRRVSTEIANVSDI